MFRLFRLWLGLLARCFRSHRTLLLENLALRQQLTVLKRRHPKPKLSPLDKLFWVSARRFWSAWKSSLVIVTPETVVRRHRAGFRRYWSLISRVKERVGKKKLSQEIRDLIFQMVTDNSTWGAPRIHGELLMLGFDVSERSISRRMKQAPQDPGLARRWQAFLRTHREVITAMDFFTVKTVTFNLLYCFFIISHDRGQIVHFNVTQHPTTSWIVQQLREAFPYESAPKFLLFDHDQKYGLEVPAALRSLQIMGVQTSIRSPWQNGVSERWVGSCRRDLLDHIIALNARHLKRLLSTYASYCHDDRTHLGLHKETPGRRIRSGATGPVICHVRLGGLHHRYDRAA
jgi:putative transposase